jgi:arylsulfatase A-like enzyme
MHNPTRRQFIQTMAWSTASFGAAAASDSAAQSPPNILFLFTDQHHAGVLGCEGHADVRTPNFDRLAAEGVRFSRAYCQDGICVPSRISIMTGQYPRTTGVLTNGDRPPFPERLHFLHDVLKARGYDTAAYGKRHLLPDDKAGWNHTATTISPKQDPSDESYEEWVSDQGQFEEYTRDRRGSFDSPLFSHISNLKDENTAEAYTARKTIEFLTEKRDPQKPFFCWCSFQRPHQPYTPTPRWAEAYDPQTVRLPDSLREPPENLPPFMERLRAKEARPWSLAEAARDEQIYRNYIAYYYALVTEIDHYVGEILSVLERKGLADNTVIIYSSDHGDFVAGHGIGGKAAAGHNVYEETLRVPLIARWPGRFRSGLLSDDLVELVDLYPTILELTGTPCPEGYSLPGRSLAPTLTEGRPVGRDYAISENWFQTTVIGKRHKLGTWTEPPGRTGDYREFGDMVFDREEDPAEMNNLAGQPEAAETEARLRECLADYESRVPAGEAKAASAERARKRPPKAARKSAQS